MQKICSVDIGSSFTKVIISQLLGSDIEILGIGKIETKGVKNGEIINMEYVCRSVEEAIWEAEKMCGIEVDSVYANISGIHIRSTNSRGMYIIANEDRIINNREVENAVINATNINLPSEYEIIHILSKNYVVDNRIVPDPIGMTGFRLEANVSIISAPKVQIKNIYKVFYKIKKNVNDIILNSIASSEAVLKETEKNTGCIIIDIGYSLTDVLVYKDSGICTAFSLPLGSYYVTSDLEYAFGITFEIAEFIKKRDGVAYIDDVDPTEKVEIPGLPGNPKKYAVLKDIAYVISARLEEIFEIISKYIRIEIDIKKLTGGVILTGGGSHILGIDKLAEKIFKLPVRLGRPGNVKGLTKEISDPEFSTAVGIIKYIAKQNKIIENKIETKKNDDNQKKILKKLKNWITDNI